MRLQPNTISNHWFVVFGTKTIHSSETVGMIFQRWGISHSCYQIKRYWLSLYLIHIWIIHVNWNSTNLFMLHSIEQNAHSVLTALVCFIRLFPSTFDSNQQGQAHKLDHSSKIRFLSLLFCLWRPFHQLNTVLYRRHMQSVDHLHFDLWLWYLILYSEQILKTPDCFIAKE